MAKYNDIRRIGRSKKVPYDQLEAPSDRHSRRLKIALEDKKEVQDFCTKHSFKLIISNEGNHWRIRGKYHFHQWWPSSAKYVLDNHWKQGTHVHDIEQLLRLICKYEKKS